MFSDDAFSDEAFSDNTAAAFDPDAFLAFMARLDVGRCWLLEIDALSLAAVGGAGGAYGEGAYSEGGFSDDEAAAAGGLVTLRWSSHGYTSLPGDTPANTHFESRIKDGFTISRDIAGRGGVGGLTRVFAEIMLSNADGALDGLASDYALDGRTVRLLVGPVDGSYADYGRVFSGVVDEITVTEQDLRLRLSDGFARLDLPAQDHVYAGTGGLEGGADLKGKRKPLAYGISRNVTPVLVDAVNLIYQVHDGAIEDVPAVRDRGVALTKVSGAPAPGEYQVNAATGTFKLGASADGEVTCDVEGDAPTAGYTDRIATIMLRLLSQRLYTSEIDTTALANLNTLISAPCGVWVGPEVQTLAQVLDRLLFGAGCYGGFSRLGVMSAGRIAAPSEDVPVIELDAESIVSIERRPLPQALSPVVWRATVGWARNHTPQSDIAALAADSDRSFALEAWRWAATENAAIKSRHLLAVEYGPVESPFDEEADGEAEAERLFALWSADRAHLVVSTTLAAAVADIGRVVQLTHPRHRLQYGKPARVLGQTIRGQRVELRVMT